MEIGQAGRAILRTASRMATRLTDNYLLERKLKAALGKPPLFHPHDKIVLTGAGPLALRLFFPRTAGPHGVLLFFHGGGWVTGDTQSYAHVLRTMADITNRTVVAVDYRLAPEHPFPAGLTDCYTVAKELYTHPERWGIINKDIVMIGDSAGGNLCAAVSLMARDRGEFQPKGQILIYPAVYNDYSESSPFASVRENGTNYILTAKRLQDYMDYYAAPAHRNSRYVAPLLCHDLSGLPPTLLFTAELDPLRDEGEAFAAALKEAGNRVELYRVPDVLHGYFSFSEEVPQVRMTYGRMNRFLRTL